ncbi:MAG TPA: hypothetical protein VGQ69_08585 [Gemmatimonadales bacterium]|jgi:hypothetical protein|nr:hypothetical protein [Gemmatimonadales bacterium]
MAGPSLSSDAQLVLQVIPGLDWRALPDDQVTILSANVESRTLHLQVQYGGGCADHGLALVTGAELAESFPPFTLLRLAHDAHGDPCDALITRSLEIDLSPIVPLVQQSGAHALRFELLEPGGQPSNVGELLLAF